MRLPSISKRPENSRLSGRFVGDVVHRHRDDTRVHTHQNYPPSLAFTGRGSILLVGHRLEACWPWRFLHTTPSACTSSATQPCSAAARLRLAQPSTSPSTRAPSNSWLMW